MMDACFEFCMLQGKQNWLKFCGNVGYQLAFLHLNRFWESVVLLRNNRG